MTTKKDPTAVRIGARIKQARQMADFPRQADLNVILIEKYGWSSGRLGNYESGQSIPRPDDVRIIAKETDSSECWIMFGVGPIRSRSRALQAVRYQNLVHVVESLKGQISDYNDFLSTAGSSPEAMEKYLTNPFKKIGDRQARRFEHAMGKKKGWIDEQHVDIDPMCNQFPDDLRELMTIFSNLHGNDRIKLLEIARLL